MPVSSVKRHVGIGEFGENNRNSYALYRTVLFPMTLHNA